MIKEIIEQSKSLNYVPTKQELKNIENTMSKMHFDEPIIISKFFKFIL
ncbi:hypothetical protein AAGG74_19240 [Bacillus mexicanus]